MLLESKAKIERKHFLPSVDVGATSLELLASLWCHAFATTREKNTYRKWRIYKHFLKGWTGGRWVLQCTVFGPHELLKVPVVWKLAQVQAAGPRYIRGRRTIYSYITSSAKRWAPGGMFSSIKYEQFVQVSNNQKHIFIMFADVRYG